MSAVKFNAYFSNEATPSEGSSNGFGETAPVKSDSNEAIPEVFSKRQPLKMMLLPARGGSEEIPDRKKEYCSLRITGLFGKTGRE